MMSLKYDKIFSKIYDCGVCDYKTKRQRGCTKKRRKPVASFDCNCKGEKKCSLCKGEGTFKWYRCPRTVFDDSSIVRVFSYYFHWLSTEYKEYANGKGLYYQPLKMLESFDILNKEYEKHYKRENIKSG